MGILLPGLLAHTLQGSRLPTRWDASPLRREGATVGTSVELSRVPQPECAGWGRRLWPPVRMTPPPRAPLCSFVWFQGKLFNKYLSVKTDCLGVAEEI